MNEIELIRNAQRGDGRAMRALYAAYSPRVYAVVRRMAGDDAQAEDWAQEAWIRAFRALPKFRGESLFSTWLHRVAVNSALHGRRTRERRLARETPMGDEARPALASPPDDDRTLLRLQLERALERVPDGMRRILVLHDVEGRTHEEIGELLGVSPGTSKSQLFKARAKMRELLRVAPESVEEVEPCHT